MLNKIVAISGKFGLFQIVTQGKNRIIVESLVDKKRIPVFSTEKVVSLGAVSVYTQTGEKPLAEVFEAMKALENGAQASIDPKSEAEQLKAYFATVLPEFDRERVYPNDIKKMIQWYNLLISNGYTDFTLNGNEEEKAHVEEGR